MSGQELTYDAVRKRLVACQARVADLEEVLREVLPHLTDPDLRARAVEVLRG